MIKMEKVLIEFFDDEETDKVIVHFLDNETKEPTGETEVMSFSDAKKQFKIMGITSNDEIYSADDYDDYDDNEDYDSYADDYADYDDNDDYDAEKDNN